MPAFVMVANVTMLVLMDVPLTKQGANPRPNIGPFLLAALLVSNPQQASATPSLQQQVTKQCISVPFFKLVVFLIDIAFVCVA